MTLYKNLLGRLNGGITLLVFFVVAVADGWIFQFNGLQIALQPLQHPSKFWVVAGWYVALALLVVALSSWFCLHRLGRWQQGERERLLAEHHAGTQREVANIKKLRKQAESLVGERELALERVVSRETQLETEQASLSTEKHNLFNRTKQVMEIHKKALNPADLNELKTALEAEVEKNQEYRDALATLNKTVRDLGGSKNLEVYVLDKNGLLPEASRAGREGIKKSGELIRERVEDAAILNRVIQDFGLTP